MYILLLKEIKRIDNWQGIEIVQTINYSFNIEQISRLAIILHRNILYTDYLNGVICFVNTACSKESVRLEYGNMYTDCDEYIYNFLMNNPDCIGSSSKYINNILLNLIDYKKYNGYKETTSKYIITKFVGDDGWKDLSHFFEFLKECKLNYVVLRKFDMYPQGFINDDHDIDILSDNRDLFAAVSNSRHRSIGISGYKTIINNNEIQLDIRYIGDNYFYPAWEKDILKNRIETNGFYCPDIINQYFTVLYHVFTQKLHISDYYNNFLGCLENELFGFKYGESERFSNLESYMSSNLYYYIKPYDYSVVQNRHYVQLLKKHKPHHALKMRIAIRVLNFLHGHPITIVERILKY